MESDDRSDENGQRRRQAPLQFRLRSILVITAVLALAFGALRWLEVPRYAGVIVLVVLAVSVLAALGLVVAIAGSAADDEDNED